jgi:two-component system, NtrC family, nitrogen regulation sensor histidine kinase NtrY
MDLVWKTMAILRPVAFGLAVLSTLLLVIMLTGVLGVELSERRVVLLMVTNAVLAALLLLVVVADIARLVRARMSGEAGARTHVRLVLLFTLVAALPTILIAFVASLTLERGLNPWFAGSLRDLVTGSRTIAIGYQQQVCQNTGREMRIIGEDVNRARRLGLFESQPSFVRELLTNRAMTLGFSYVAVMRRDGGIVERAAPQAGTEDPPQPSAADFSEADTAEPPCIIGARFVGALIQLREFPGAYLHVARPLDGRAFAFATVAELAVQQYQTLDANRGNVQRAFAVMYALISLTLLLGVLWIGLSLADRFVEPIRRLIHATDEVAGGNFYVQVPVLDAEGDVAHLGSTFNNMTSRIRAQQNRLVAANELIDRRRQFTEAVLSGVSVGVIGLDAEGVITVVNPAALAILGIEHAAAIDRPLADVSPEVRAVVAETATHSAFRVLQRQITLVAKGREKTVLLRVASDRDAPGPRGLIVTLDDISDLVTAQRTSAWADVARRIAHEIKNPLTPIQLSAERIKRKYGRLIEHDREVLDQCTATIVRQVEDIRRMVDEFSSFARMPKPAPENEDIVDTLRQALFLMRVAHPGITFEDNLPEYAVTARFDRRLIGQVAQNLLKNATEAIGASDNALSGRIDLHLTMSDDRMIHIDVIDNGKGFPAENRQRLLEPYMTDRVGGTGLGLAIVAKILEDHGGAIQLLDSPMVAFGGTGARVRASFPQAGPALSSDEPGARAPAPREAEAANAP